MNEVVNQQREAGARAFKVLVNGCSAHRGTMVWSLPTQNEDGSYSPGDWHEVTGTVSCCVNGLHLTTKPALWWLDGATVFEAEYEGETDREYESDDKFAARRARLVAPAAWADHNVVSEGHHDAKDGHWRAFDSATVRASGSATVRAFDSATVRASGSATVEAYGSATVRASGSATVRAYGSATVEAYGSATVIRAGGGWSSHRGFVKLADLAALVDRRTEGKVSLAAAPFSDLPEDLPAALPAPRS